MSITITNIGFYAKGVRNSRAITIAQEIIGPTTLNGEKCRQICWKHLDRHGRIHENIVLTNAFRYPPESVRSFPSMPEYSDDSK